MKIATVASLLRNDPALIRRELALNKCGASYFKVKIAAVAFGSSAMTGCFKIAPSNSTMLMKKGRGLVNW